VTTSTAEPAKAAASLTRNGITWYHVRAERVQDIEFVRQLCGARRLDLHNCVSVQRLNRPGFHGDSDV
jgi:hypothetical protein